MKTLPLKCGENIYKTHNNFNFSGICNKKQFGKRQYKLCIEEKGEKYHLGRIIKKNFGSVAQVAVLKTIIKVLANWQ
jgi:hypothetical protein